MAIKQRNKINAAFSMSSMTDVVFLLLIFFLVTSTLINPNALKLLLPKSTNQISAKPQVSVSIKHYQETNTFSYHINGLKQETPFEQVEVSIQALLQNNALHLVLLRRAPPPAGHAAPQAQACFPCRPGGKADWAGRGGRPGKAG